MPAKSAKQERLMQAVAHNPKFAKKVGISQKVGKEFVGMAEGGEVANVKEAEDANALGMSVPEYRASRKAAPPAPPPDQGKFFTPPSKADIDKRRAGPPRALLEKQARGFAAGGSIDGCAQRGRTRAGRR